MDSDRKLILDFLETGKGKQKVQQRLKESSFKRLYLSITRDEAALYQTFEEVKIKPVKFKKKKRKPKLLLLSAIAAILGMAFLYMEYIKTGIARNTVTAEVFRAGSTFESDSPSSFTLNDGSTLTFEGPSKVLFESSDRIKVLDGLMQAKIEKRPENKLTFDTPSGPFTVLGTEFSLLVKGGSSLLEVTEGKVGVADTVIKGGEMALLEKSGELITDPALINKSSVLRKLAALPSASIVSDLISEKGKITNMVNGEKIKLIPGVTSTKTGLKFDQTGALVIKPAGEPSINWNLSLWIKYDSSENRRAIASHENFTDKNMGGWNLYYFRENLRLHSVKQPYFHDVGDVKSQADVWFHMSLNVKSLGNGRIQEDFYINGKKVISHKKLMLFLKDNVSFLLGGLTQNAMSVFTEKEANFYYKGELGDLVYMNDNLTESQIKTLYESGKERFR